MPYMNVTCQTTGPPRTESHPRFSTEATYRVQCLFSLAMLMMNLGVHVGVPNNAGGLEKNSKLIEMTC